MLDIIANDSDMRLDAMIACTGKETAASRFFDSKFNFNLFGCHLKGLY